jgi:hypothetical protein
MAIIAVLFIFGVIFCVPVFIGVWLLILRNRGEAERTRAHLAAQRHEALVRAQWERYNAEMARRAEWEQYNAEMARRAEWEQYNAEMARRAQAEDLPRS